jgi:hypothetical protein
MIFLIGLENTNKQKCINILQKLNYKKTNINFDVNKLYDIEKYEKNILQLKDEKNKIVNLTYEINLQKLINKFPNSKFIYTIIDPLTWINIVKKKKFSLVDKLIFGLQEFNENKILYFYQNKYNEILQYQKNNDNILTLSIDNYLEDKTIKKKLNIFLSS